MYSLSNRNRRKFQKHWLSFRLYSRQVIDQPMNMDIHTSRIMAAMELDEKEPLQGALADMFYGCWFDVPYFGDRMLNQVREKLTPTLLQGFDSSPLSVGRRHSYNLPLSSLPRLPDHD